MMYHFFGHEQLYSLREMNIELRNRAKAQFALIQKQCFELKAKYF